MDSINKFNHKTIIGSKDYKITEPQIKRFAGLFLLISISLLIARHLFGHVEDSTNVLSYFILSLFLFIYLFTGPVISGWVAAWVIVIGTWIALSSFSLFVGGLKLPIVVVFPLVPVMAMMMINNRATIISSGLSILSIVLLIILELLDVEFKTIAMTQTNTNIMRGLWLIFIIVTMTIIGRFYTTKIKSLTSSLQEHADTDYLTGTASHKMLENALTREFYRKNINNSALSSLLIDIDNYKKIASSSGKILADECMTLTGQKLLTLFKQPTITVGRSGCDEFIVVLPDISHKETLEFAKKIKSSISELDLFVDAKNNTQLSVSINCLSIPQNIKCDQEKSIHQLRSPGDEQLNSINTISLD